MNKMLFATLAIAGLAGFARPSVAAVDVVTSTPELAAIAREVGGNLVSVQSLARPDADYHRVDAKPTDVVKIARADVFVRIGMDMDMWADALLNSARNSKVARGAVGYVDASSRIRRQDVPTGSISGASGDVHAAGNPHYWLDPKNGIVIAYEIDLALRGVDPKNAATYDANYARFAADINKRLAGWERDLAPFKGKPVVAYHDEWVYFYTRFGLREFGYLEPKPGIPPSGGHISSLMSRMKSSGVKAVIVPSIYSLRYAELLKKEDAATVSVVPYSVGSLGTKTYADYIDTIVAGFRKALQ